jgi:hypothetical protein
MKDQKFYAEFAFLLVKYKATHKANKYRGIPLSSICGTLESIMKIPRESLHYCNHRSETPVALTIPARDIFSNKSRSINSFVASEIG